MPPLRLFDAVPEGALETLTNTKIMRHHYPFEGKRVGTAVLKFSTRGENKYLLVVLLDDLLQGFCVSIHQVLVLLIRRTGRWMADGQWPARKNAVCVP